MRVAPLRIRADRLAELRRILGDDVEVTETTLTEPGTVEAIAAAIVADAVVIDIVAPPALPGLVTALGAYTRHISRTSRLAWLCPTTPH